MSFSSSDKAEPSPAAVDATDGHSEPTGNAEDGEISDHEPPRSQSPEPAPNTAATANGPQSTPSEPARPPLPTEPLPPPLPTEAPPTQPADDGWEPIWDDGAQAFYFFNRFTNISQWENPRVQDAQQSVPPGVGNDERSSSAKRVGGYDPAIHGDYDPNADYAKAYQLPGQDEAAGGGQVAHAPELYAATGAFNRFTGKWQNADLNPDKFSDDQKSRRQMNAFFDVDAAANSHEGRSLRAERASKKLTKAELKAFREKRKEKKEERRRAWLRD